MPAGFHTHFIDLHLNSAVPPPLPPRPPPPSPPDFTEALQLQLHPGSGVLLHSVARVHAGGAELFCCLGAGAQRPMGWSLRLGPAVHAGGSLRLAPDLCKPPRRRLVGSISQVSPVRLRLFETRTTSLQTASVSADAALTYLYSRFGPQRPAPSSRLRPQRPFSEVLLRCDRFWQRRSQNHIAATLPKPYLLDASSSPCLHTSSSPADCLISPWIHGHVF